MKDRLRSVMEYAKLSQQDFAARLGVSAPSISSIFKGRQGPTNYHVMAIHRAFPEININWLMFGEGEMIVSSASKGEDSKEFSQTPVANDLFTESVESNSSEDLRMAEQTIERMNALFNGDSPIARQMARHKIDLLTDAKKVDIKPRKIKEIRVFYDDGTYESFAPTSR